MSVMYAVNSSSTIQTARSLGQKRPGAPPPPAAVGWAGGRVCFGSLEFYLSTGRRETVRPIGQSVVRRPRHGHADSRPGHYRRECGPSITTMTMLKSQSVDVNNRSTHWQCSQMAPDATIDRRSTLSSKIFTQNDAVIFNCSRSRQ